MRDTPLRPVLLTSDSQVSKKNESAPLFPTQPACPGPPFPSATGPHSPLRKPREQGSQRREAELLPQEMSGCRLQAQWEDSEESC